MNIHCLASHPVFTFNRGYTLVEFLVAAALGLLIITAVTSSLISARQTFRTGEALSDVQEVGRFAHYFMGIAIRNAGYLPNPRIQFDPASMFQPDNMPAMRGWDSGAPSLDAIIQGSLPRDISPDPKNTRTDSNFIAVSYLGSEDGNIGVCLTRDDGLLEDQAVVTIFYLTPSASADEVGNLNCAVQFLDCDTAGMNCVADGQARIEPLLRGVESMRIRYGEDTDNDSGTNRWVTAGAVVDWSRVTAVEVVLKVRSEQATEFGPSVASADVDDMIEAGLVDRRAHRTFRNIYTVRNRLVM